MSFGIRLKERFCAGLLFVSLIVLHVSIIVVTPEKLSMEMSPRGLNKFIHALEMTNDNIVVSPGSDRIRGRVFLALILASALTLFLQYVVKTNVNRPLMQFFYQWNDRIGYESEAMPHNDMVARK